ncbi:CHAT domain-containing protein [Fischerella thermalis]|nr:CHAT domain-containing protein [Fischerella thermalis]
MATFFMPLNYVRADGNRLKNYLKNTLALVQSQNVLVFQNPNKIEVALEISERGRARAFVELLARRLGLSTINPPTTDQIKQVAKQQNATLVEYSLITNELAINGKHQTQESELFIWVIKPTGEILFRRVDLKKMLPKENNSLADFINQTPMAIGTSNRSIIPITSHAKEKLKKLYEILIHPISDILPTNPDEHVIFIPQGELFLVPFAALQNAQGKYLIENHTISTAPSIQALDLLAQFKQRHKRQKTQDVLVVGNPIMPTVVLKPGDKPHQFSPIPGAEQEAKAIATIMNTQALTGKAATEIEVVQRIPKARIIHLATNTYIDTMQGFKSFLAFAPSASSDGLLTIDEINNLQLYAELVVLSSSQTALGRITGDGVIGLSRAFFAAGVPSVIGSLWYVSNQSTLFFMTEFYKNLRENTDKATALRQAMLATMKKYPHPMEWAAFTLIGVS